MLTTRLRFAIILLFLIIGIVLNIKLGISNAWYLYLAALILLITHFLFGNVSAAFVNLRRGKIGVAEKLLLQIKRPEWLLKSHRAYYHFTKGMIALQHEWTEEGEEHLKKALDIGLRSSTDNALAALNIAHIYFVGKRIEDAHTFLQKAKSFNSDDLLIKQKISEMELALARPYN